MEQPLPRGRIIALLALIGHFLARALILDRVRRPASGQLAEGGPETIRGVVKALLPSGKVIVVKKENGDEIFLSLTDASSITNELGEDLFYSDVKTGMPISAAGIRGMKDNVVLPSLVTIGSSYAHQGLLVAKNIASVMTYFTLRYDPKIWSPAGEAILRNSSIGGCLFRAAPPPFSVPGDWVKSSIERKIGGNVFEDARYTLKGEPALRVVTLTDPGIKYEAESDSSLGGPYGFTLLYESKLAEQSLLSCIRGADEILSSFMLRNASPNILLIEPRLPIRAAAGTPLKLSGMAHAYEGTITAVLQSESGKKVSSALLSVKASGSKKFAPFDGEIGVPASAESVLHLKVFQYSPSSGAVTDLIELPVWVEF